jgi:hypothetical protein
MSRSGYSDDCNGWSLVCWRGAVTSALRGTRGQAFLREALAALDAMPEKRLSASVLVAADGCCCTMGAVARARGIDTSGVDAYDREDVAKTLGIAEAMAAEIAHENDWIAERVTYVPNDKGGLSRVPAESPEARWVRMRAWVAAKIKAAP